MWEGENSFLFLVPECVVAAHSRKGTVLCSSNIGFPWYHFLLFLPSNIFITNSLYEIHCFSDLTLADTVFDTRSGLRKQTFKPGIWIHLLCTQS